MLQTSQTFLRSSNSNFVEKVTKAFLSADIPLYKLNNKYAKNLFSDICHSLLTEITCRKTVLKLSADKLQRIRNVDDKQIFWRLMKALYLARFKYFTWNPRHTSCQLFVRLLSFTMFTK